MTKLLRIPFISALLGAGVVVAVLAATGELGGNTSTTVVEQAPLAASATPASDTKGLTPRDIYRRDAPGVVFITAHIVQQDNSFIFPQTQQGTATGSGFVIDKDGDILTNAHVIEGATSLSVKFSDEKSVTAKIVGRDVSTDLAVIKVNPKGLNLKPLALGSSKPL
jgi:S1-C subfamily serine protease